MQNGGGCRTTALATATRYTWDDATDLLETALGDVIRDAQRTLRHGETGLCR